MTERHYARVLIAGVGNIFLGDDGFGVELARRLAARQLPEHVRVVDVGIRSLHLAYELLERRYDLVIFLDVIARGGAPGTLSVIEPDEPAAPASPVDAHGVRPDHVIANLRALGGSVGRVLVLGCEPACLDEGVALSTAVTAALPEAERMLMALVDEPGPVIAR